MRARGREQLFGLGRHMFVGDNSRSMKDQDRNIVKFGSCLSQGNFFRFGSTKLKVQVGTEIRDCELSVARS